MKGSQANFARIASAPSLAEARLAAVEVAAIGPSSTAQRAETGAAQLKNSGSASIDLTFVPLNPPCRLIDTRGAGGGGAFTAKQKRTYNFTQRTQYGGVGCSPIPLGSGPEISDPAAIAVNVTVQSNGIGSTNSLGFLSLVPSGSSDGPTSFMNYDGDENYNGDETVANAGVVTLNQVTGTFDIFAQIPTQVIVDCYGSFVTPEHTPVVW